MWHRPRAQLVDFEARDSSSEAMDDGGTGRKRRADQPDLPRAADEAIAAGENLWIVELLNRLDQERDDLRATSKPVLVSLNGKTTRSRQATAAGTQRAASGASSGAAAPEHCSRCADTETDLSSPVLDAGDIAADQPRSAWPFALYGLAALGVLGGATALLGSRSDRIDPDTADPRAIPHAVRKPAAGLRDVREIPPLEAAIILPPDGSIRISASPDSVSAVIGDPAELAATVESPPVPTAASSPDATRMPLPQGPTAGIVAPPKPIIPTIRPTIDVTGHDARDEERGAIVPNRGKTRIEPPLNASVSAAADRMARLVPPDEGVKAKSDLKVPRPHGSAHITRRTEPLRREPGSNLPRTAKVPRLKNFTLPLPLRPTTQ